MSDSNPISDFTVRSCPICDGNANKRLIEIAAHQLAEDNWSYSEHYAELLQVNPSDKFWIVKCSDCAFVFSELLPSAKFLDTPEADKNYRSDNPRRLRYLADLNSLLTSSESTNVRVLDFGAGYGQTSRILKSLGIEVTAFETSSRRRESLERFGIQTLRQHSEILEAESFDAIICDNVLEHLPNPKNELSLFQQALKENGILYISVPSYESNEIRRAKIKPDMSTNPWEHLNYFNNEQLDRLLTDHCFVSIKPVEVNIGLRNQHEFYKRFKNTLASNARLVRFLFTGSGTVSVNSRIYRLDSKK